MFSILPLVAFSGGEGMKTKFLISLFILPFIVPDRIILSGPYSINRILCSVIDCHGTVVETWNGKYAVCSVKFNHQHIGANIFLFHNFILFVCLLLV